MYVYIYIYTYIYIYICISTIYHVHVNMYSCILNFSMILVLIVKVKCKRPRCTVQFMTAHRCRLLTCPLLTHSTNQHDCGRLTIYPRIPKVEPSWNYHEPLSIFPLFDGRNFGFNISEAPCDAVIGRRAANSSIHQPISPITWGG